MVNDLPAGGRRLIQRVDGYRATVVAGEVTFEDGEPTGARPGRLVRFEIVASMELRLATADDNEAIRAIYNVEVVESTVTFDLVPRSAEQQHEWLSARSGAHAVLVAEDGGEVVGLRFTVALPRPTRLQHERRGLGLRAP